MQLALVIVHIIVSIALIMIVLLQTGKGADMGAAFGGGASQTLFGATGASTFLGKATTVAAIVFMLTCLGLAYVSTGGKSVSSVMKNVEQPAAPPPVTDSQSVPATADTAADTQKETTEAPVAADSGNTAVADQPEPTTPVEAAAPADQPEATTPEQPADSPSAEQTE